MGNLSTRCVCHFVGGPIAHLGYFERTYVKEKCWLSHEEYSHLVALAQLLPGPASSQVNFLIGLRRSGWPGALSSWAGFTLPSALLLYAFAVLAPKAHGPLLDAALHGLKLVAVAIVAQAVWGMAARLCPDRARTGIALAGLALLLLFGGAFAQIAVIVMTQPRAYGFADISQATAANRDCQRQNGMAALRYLEYSCWASRSGRPAPGGLVSLAEVSTPGARSLRRRTRGPAPYARLKPSGMLTDGLLAGYGVAQVLGPCSRRLTYAAAAPAGLTRARARPR